MLYEILATIEDYESENPDELKYKQGSVNAMKRHIIQVKDHWINPVLRH